MPPAVQGRTARPRAPALPRAHRRLDPVHPPPGDPHARPRPRPAASPQKGDPAVTTITITIWHNVARDQDDRPTGMLEGYHPGDPAVRVFTFQADPARRPGTDRRRGVRHLQRPPGRRRRRRPGPPLLRARAAVAVVPRKVSVLRLVVLPGVSVWVVPGSTLPRWLSAPPGFTCGASAPRGRG